MKLAIEEMENFAKEKVNEIQSGSSSQSLAGMLNTEIATLLRGGGDIGPREPEELQWRAGFYVFGARYSGRRAEFRGDWQPSEEEARAQVTPGGTEKTTDCTDCARASRAIRDLFRAIISFDAACPAVSVSCERLSHLSSKPGAALFVYVAEFVPPPNIAAGRAVTVKNTAATGGASDQYLPLHAPPGLGRAAGFTHFWWEGCVVSDLGDDR
ncbi:MULTISPECIES: hypothetical protein [unclassified Ensifer]|uniref:hypothetical protein n=1 Tax=unclassified Ensifer TaxID=2633371 RepID=UPI0012E359A6|nr:MULTISPECIES: hypothetical protein [unclassified Ensifer]